LKFTWLTPKETYRTGKGRFLSQASQFNAVSSKFPLTGSCHILCAFMFFFLFLILILFGNSQVSSHLSMRCVRFAFFPETLPCEGDLGSCLDAGKASHGVRVSPRYRWHLNDFSTHFHVKSAELGTILPFTNNIGAFCGVVFFEGSLGGLAYVNTFDLVLKTVRPTSTLSRFSMPMLAICETPPWHKVQE
uniref:TLDc domain-containing protein n=1 Tax=Hydatigena taeniaeformis TaxID=6205 RepID=A0A0R3WW51_HYDTA